MGRIWMPGGAGGADVDVVTAGAGDVLKGKVIVDKNGNPLTGTLELTGTAADSHVLSGYTYYNTDPKTKRNGGIPNQGAKTAALNCGGSYTIPAGYHNGAGKVTANSLASQTSATAVTADLLSGKTAWVNGTKITGTMGTQAGGTYTPGTSAQTISCSGKKMTGNIVINPIPNTYANTSSWSVFRRGVYAGNFGIKPYLYSIEMQYGGTCAFKASGYTPCTQNFTGADVDNSNQQCTYTGISQDVSSVGWEDSDSGGSDILGYVFFNRAVDLTNYTKLYVQCWFSANNQRSTMELIPTSRKYSDKKTFAVASNRASSFRGFTFDISALKGQYYIHSFPTGNRNMALIEMTFKN